MVAAIQFYASSEDVTALLDHLGEGRTTTIWPWPVVQLEPVSLSREEASTERAVVILSGELGPPAVIHRDDPVLDTGSVTAVLTRLNFRELHPADGLGLIHPDRSPVLFWQPGDARPNELTTHSIGSQAKAMRAVSPDYERWVTQTMSWIRRHGTKVWGLEMADVRPDLDIRVPTVSAIYALPGALRLLEDGATGA